MHRQKRRWPVPQAALILDMHTQVHSLQKRLHHAEITVAIPVKGGIDYFTFGHTARTEIDAVRRVIEIMENSTWFHHFRKHDVRFRVTGVLENVYRGFL